MILTYDSDGAGVKAALRAIPILKDVGISIKVLNMQPHKDPDEFIKNMGPEAFRQRIKEARNSFLFEVDVLKRTTSWRIRSRKRNFIWRRQRCCCASGTPGAGQPHQAVSREQMIPHEELRQLVNRLGMTMGLKAGELQPVRGTGRRPPAGT